MTTPLMRHLAATIAANRDVSIEATFHMADIGDVTVGASWYRRERDEQIGEGEHQMLDQRLRVPAHLLPRKPGAKDKVTIDGKLHRIDGPAAECGPVYLVDLQG